MSSNLTRGGDDKGSRWEERCSLAWWEQDNTLEPWFELELQFYYCPNEASCLHPRPHPFLNYSFLVGLTHPPQWKASCTLKHVFQLEDLPLAQPYVPLLFSGILPMKLPNLLQAGGQQPSSKCVLLRVHKHVALLSACRSKNLHGVLQSFMFYSSSSVWSSGIWERRLLDVYEYSPYILT